MMMTLRWVRSAVSRCSTPSAWLRRVGARIGGGHPAGESRPARTPEGLRIYAVGDVHGELDKLERLIEAISADMAAAAAPRVLVVFLGDYVDRGSDSRGVLDRLCRPIWPQAELRFLRGNHEAALAAFLRAPLANAGWLTHGGSATLMSYGVPPVAPDDAADRLQRASAALAGRMDVGHRLFLDRLQLYHVAGSYLFVHAGLRPGRGLDQQRDEDLLWIREPFLSSTADHGWRVVHGHTIVDRPEILPNRIAIDTGAYAGGPLSCVVLHEDRVEVLQANDRN